MAVDSLARSSVEQTHRRILAATREIFAQKGSRGTTTREVAERADVNEATLFRHFGTKQQLLQAMLDCYCDAQAEERMSFLDRLQGSLEEQLREVACSSIQRMTERQDLIRVAMAEEALNPESSMLTWRSPTVAQRKLTEYMLRKIEAGELRGDPGDLARVFMSLTFAYVFATKIWSKQTIAQERAIESLVDIFLNGARNG